MGCGPVAGLFQQVCPDGFEAMVVDEAGVVVEGADQREGRRGAVDVGEGDGPAQCDQRSRGDGFQDFVQGEDLGPVRLVGGGSLVVERGDRGLNLVRANGGGAQGPVEEG